MSRYESTLNNILLSCIGDIGAAETKKAHTAYQKAAWRSTEGGRSESSEAAETL